MNQHKALPSTVLFRKILLKHIRHDCIKPVGNSWTWILDHQIKSFYFILLLVFIIIAIKCVVKIIYVDVKVILSLLLFMWISSSVQHAIFFFFYCLIISLLQGSVLPEVIERLELFHHEFSSADELFDLLRVAHILILGKRSPQPVSEIVGSFRILPSKKQQLQAEESEEKTGLWVSIAWSHHCVPNVFFFPHPILCLSS